jgi:predicted nucleic-acid-binding Zn-ribbon protein
MWKKRGVSNKTKGTFDIVIPLSTLSNAFVSAYICTACGYTEFYVQDEDQREKIRSSTDRYLKV